MSTVAEFPRASDYSAELAANIRAEAARRRITQAELARAIGANTGTISRRFQGRYPWTIDELRAVAGVLGLRIVDLLPDETEPAGSWYAPRDSNPEPSDSGSVLVSEAVVVDLDAYRAAREAVGA